MKRILVTGGAGYIGSHTVLQLVDRGYDVVVVDSLVRGYRDAVDAKLLRQADIHDAAAMDAIFAEKQVDAVIHFAAFISVGESMQKPEMYFANNTGGSLALFSAMQRARVKHVVFSSTAAIFGAPGISPIAEDTPHSPINPYGESKLMTEQILDWFDKIYSLRAIALRYFNAAGADPKGRAGERHDPETHLIPLLLRAVRTGTPITLYGDDYPTPDGTCIRDYVHVADLAQAHILSVEWLLGGGKSDRFNAGNGTGYSIRQVMDSVERVTKKKVPHTMGPRREGDPPELVADSRKLKSTLGWKPEFADLDRIVETAWVWASKQTGLLSLPN